MTTNHVNIQTASAETRSLRSSLWIIQCFAVSVLTNSRYLLLACLLLMGAAQVQAQFVDIQIDLPARSEVQSLGSLPAAPGTERPEPKKGQLADDAPAPGFRVQGGSQLAALQWLGISVAENMQLVVEISYRPLATGEKQLSAAYLNNGTTNTAQSVAFSGSRAVFAVSNSGQLIREMARRPKSLTAWIGVPPGQTRELTIEYN